MQIDKKRDYGKSEIKQVSVEFFRESINQRRFFEFILCFFLLKLMYLD